MALSSHALTTVNEVKNELEISPSDTSQDALIERLINAASEAIENYCDRHFEKAQVTERLAGYGRSRIVLSRTPVLQIVSVSVNGSVLPADSYMLEDAETGFLYRLDGVWPWTARYMSGTITSIQQPGSEERSIEVTYIGGYVLPKDDSAATPRTLPYIIEQACIATVASMYRRRGSDLNILRESLQSAMVAYALQELPEIVKKWLEPYRRF